MGPDGLRPRLLRLLPWFVLCASASCGLAEDERDDKNRYIYVEFADAAFRDFCLGAFDADGDGRLSRNEAQRVRRMECPGLGIRSLYGIDEFSNLERLECPDNDLAELDLRRLRRLERLDCSRNRLATLDIRGLRSLVWLDCSRNALAALNLASCASLAWFDGRENPYPMLDVSGCSRELAADLTDCASLATVHAIDGQRIAVDGYTEVVLR